MADNRDSDSHPIPAAALDDRLGILGMTGSGKTYGAGTLVERILAQRGRVIIFDPLGCWWGLRQIADGKSASPYEIVIFGGSHADLPITPHAGAIIGETVAGMRESAIIDLSQFETAAAERRFMVHFLDGVYHRSTGEPVHLVFDEADMWAPERIMDKEGEATKLHGVMQKVVRRGRVKGLTSWLISQRPAALSKNVLSQIDGLVAFRLTASQDRKALGLWIEGQADREAGKAILGRLPEKQQGQAVVWLPAHRILNDVTFPIKLTYDSSRAPKRGEPHRRVEITPLNVAALKVRLAHVEAEAKANDPKALRAENVKLKAELTKAAKTNQPIDPKLIEDAEMKKASRNFLALSGGGRQRVARKKLRATFLRSPAADDLCPVLGLLGNARLPKDLRRLRAGCPVQCSRGWLATANGHLVAIGDAPKSARLHSVIMWMRGIFGDMKCWFWATIWGKQRVRKSHVLSST
jgi:uncharacterized protein